MGLIGSTLASKLRIALVAVVLLGGTIAGGFAAGLLGAPEVTGIDNRFGEVNETTTTIESDIEVRNPNPIGASADVTVDYAIEMNGVRMAEGTREGVAIERGNSTVPLTTYLSNDRIPAWWATHVANDEVTTLTVDADVHAGFLGRSFGAPEVERTIETDIVGAFDNDYDPAQPLNAGAEPVVRDPVLYLNGTGGSWADVTEEETRIDMQFTLYNPKPYPIRLETIGYDVRMNDVSMGEGRTDRAYTIQPGATETVEATTVVRNDRLDEWWVSHLQRDQVTTMEVDFFLVLDLSAVGAGEQRVALDTMTQTVETDIFGNEEGTDAGESDGESEPTPTPTPSEGSGEGTATPTHTSEPTPTPTPEPTSTSTPTPTPTQTPTSTPDDGGGGLL